MIINKHKLDGLTGERLEQLHDSPKQLFYRGIDPNELLKRPTVAIVGSRKMSAYGNAVTTKLADQLTRAGVLVISGLALGVDSAAQKAVLAAGGQTIAVMAHGLDKILPASHNSLGLAIVNSGGSLVSEYPAGFPPTKYTFVARDRLIAALADAVIVTEAAIKSGSLHTAGFALDLGKPVLAVPGPITSELSAGTNLLIKTGALTLTDYTDVLTALNLKLSGVQQSFNGLSANEQAIIDAISSGSTGGTDILSVSRLEPSVFAQTMTMLEISGHIRALGADSWTII